MIGELILSGYRVMFAHPIFYKFNKLLFRLSLCGLGVGNYKNYYVSGEVSFARSYLGRNDNNVVLDVGANVGDYSKMVCGLGVGVNVYAFEPHPLTFKKLESSNLSSSVVCLNYAVGKESGVFDFYDYADLDGSSHASLSFDVIERVHGKRSVSHVVEVINLDEFLGRLDISEVNLLKIDVEGWELGVIQGARKSISKGMIKAIQFEFNEMNISTRTFFRDVWDALPDYRIYRLLPGGMIEIREYSALFNEIYGYQNFVAIHCSEFYGFK